MLNIAWPAVLVLPARPDAAAKVLQVDGPAAVADIERTTVAALHERTSAEIDQRAHRRAEAGIGGRRLQGRELDLHLLAIPVEQGDVVLERRDATDLGALRDYRVESRNPPQEREAERARSHPAYLADRWIRESGIHAHPAAEEIGRESCRARVCRYVEISVVSRRLKKKKQSNKQE